MHGYSLPFRVSPSKPNITGNRKSALQNSEFVDSQLVELLATRVIKQVDAVDINCLYVHPLSVAKGKKLRLVLDLSHLNQFLEVPKIKLDDLGTILHALPKGGYMATFDFKSGYHQVRIKDEHQIYLGFSWKNIYYQFCCLPFGLSSAPHIFTKLLRVWVKKFREQGRGVAIYIDDGLIFEPSRERCLQSVASIKHSLLEAGWQFADAKCIWEPQQRANWLGFTIDLSSMSFRITPDRLQRAKNRLVDLYKRPTPSLYHRLRWSGTLSSLHLIMNQRDKRNSKAVAAEVALAQAEEHQFSHKWALTEEEKGELKYWQLR
ncbi:reverse transcriptase [Oesophagostomum dentatum]|uniref:Reverse transcriptase n=1 Tax=Oesophagostomum dentatum TaxID=61180 RepID=A0A0B1S394_OESDE|nr:reverse transcriptase [Oesophagostomum dentatum]